MSHYQRRFLPSGATRKRKEKEREDLNSANAKPLVRTASPALEPSSSNSLLAGYMAFEFLTEGTLLGQKFYPARADAISLAGSSSSLDQSKKMKPLPQQAATSTSKESSPRKEHHSYAEVANILKTDGAHIPGIINPTLLSWWIQR